MHSSLERAGVTAELHVVVRPWRHRGADQWMYVVAGTGVAIVNGERVELRASTLVLIQRGDLHEIRNTGKSALESLNIYVPPAYTEQGDELSSGRP
jgi:mannose-6-phosphate isomerase-like protein (cupin superfamily)